MIFYHIQITQVENNINIQRPFLNESHSIEWYTYPWYKKNKCYEQNFIIKIFKKCVSTFIYSSFYAEKKTICL